jgi:branched-chain amino acid transport system permease protein
LAELIWRRAALWLGAFCELTNYERDSQTQRCLQTLISMQKLRISPEAAFSVNDWTAFVIFIVVIGGIGRMEGPLIGTIVFFLLRGLLADLGPWYLMLLGAFAIIITLTMPKGIAGLLAERFDLDLFPLRRRVRLPKQKSNENPSKNPKISEIGRVGI